MHVGVMKVASPAVAGRSFFNEELQQWLDAEGDA